MSWWLAAIGIALIAGILLGRWLAANRRPRDADAATAATIEHLTATNALLRTLTSSPDVPRSLFELALRIRAIVPCDRVEIGRAHV